MFLSICYHIIINDDHLFWMNEWITTSNVWWRWWWPVNQFIYLWWWWWEWLTGGKVNFFCILYNKCPASVVVVVVVCLYLMVASLYKLLTSISLSLPNAIGIGITFDRAIHFCSSFCSSIVYDWSQSSIFLPYVDLIPFFILLVMIVVYCDQSIWFKRLICAIYLVQGTRSTVFFFLSIQFIHTWWWSTHVSIVYINVGQWEKTVFQFFLLLFSSL